jgi:glycosyltransferase involved in cell wall biosynthesis
MIKVDLFEEGLPVSVIIPYTPSPVRRKFFEQFVLPSIEAMNPAEIIINDNAGSAPKKRNDGFAKATQEYVLFSDDDIVYPADFLDKMIDVLEKNSKKGYAYCGYNGIVMNPATHPIKNNFRIPTIPFNAQRLKQGNYISTMSLMRKSVFPGFDESLKRLQDYDLWITLAKKGVEGIAVPEVEFLAFYLDSGITSNTNNEADAINALRNKHWDFL